MRTRMLIAAGLTLGVVVTLSGAPLAQGTAPAPGFAAAIEKGEALLKARKYEEALGAFKQANDLEKKKSAAAFLGISRAYHGLGAFKSEADACADGLKFVGENPSLAAFLHNQRGMALASLAEKNTDKEIKDAEAEFRAAVALTDQMPIAWYNLGVILMKQSRDDDGRAALKNYLDRAVRAPEIELATKMIENPRRAREEYAPDYKFTSLGGEAISSGDLLGKVVLLDFWGTWCGPCRQASEDLVRIYKKYSQQPGFVMLGISSDGPNDKGKVIDYTNSKGMEWPQYIDANRAIHRAFDVSQFPTYIVVDPEGVMMTVYQSGRQQTRLLGWGSTMAGQIEDGIKRALKKLSKSPPDSFARLGAPGSSLR